jgi:hypothetical protein
VAEAVGRAETDAVSGWVAAAVCQATCVVVA